MSTFYWVGGTGTWDASTTTNWATSSGGSGGAGFPTSADDVVFDANSNVGTGAFTVTCNTGAVCRNFTAGSLDGAMTLTLTTALTLYGDFTAAPTNFAVTSAATALTFAGTGTQTITSAGVTLTTVTLTGTGTVRQADALNLGARNLTLNAGTFDTQGYNFTALSILSTAVLVNRTLNLNNSVVTLSGNFSINYTNQFAFNAGTSSITFTGVNSALLTPNLYGPGVAFYDVTFSSSDAANVKNLNVVAGSTANTYRNFTTIRNSNSARTNGFYLVGDHTVTGTLTVPASAAITNRFSFISISGSTLSVAAVSSLSDVDFANVTVTGAAAPLSGTRLGDGGGNSGISGFAAGVTKYWNNTAGGNWSSASWALSSGGAVSINNFPLPQDPVVIDNTGLSATKTILLDWWFTCGSLDASTLTNAATLFMNSSTLHVCGSYAISAALTLGSSGSFYFGRGATTCTVTSAGTFAGIGVAAMPGVGGTVRFLDNPTFVSGSLLCYGAGTIDLNGRTFTIGGSNGFQKAFRCPNTIAFNNATLNVQVNALFSQPAYGNTTVTGPGTITMSRATGKSFTNTGCVDFSAIDLVQAGAGTLTMNSGNAAVPGSYGTFKSLTATTLPSTVSFASGQPFGFVAFNPAGTAGNLLTLNATAVGTQATLIDVSGINNLFYCSIKDLNATGGAIWNAMVVNGNVDAGNNTGWYFNPVSFGKYMYTRRKNKRISP